MRYLHYEGLYKPIAHRNLTPTSSKLRSAVVKTTICSMLVSHYLPHTKYLPGYLHADFVSCVLIT